MPRIKQTIATTSKSNSSQKASDNQSAILYRFVFTKDESNSLDICILEWCKLFVDSRGKHYWRKVITEPITFYDGLINTLNITEEEFNTYIEEVKSYRDKFIAHLDSEDVMHIPHLDPAKQSASYLYDYLRNVEDNGNYINETPDNAETRFNLWTEIGDAIYEE